MTGTVVLVLLVTALAVASAVHAGLGVRKSSALVREYRARLRRHPFDVAGTLHYSALSVAELEDLNSGEQTWASGYPSPGEVAEMSRAERVAYLERARILQRLAPLAGPATAVIVPVVLSQFGGWTYRELEAHVPGVWAQMIAGFVFFYAILAILAALALGVAVEGRAARVVAVLEASLKPKERRCGLAIAFMPITFLRKSRRP